MKHALAPVAALLLSVSILLTGQGLQGTLLPVRASLEGFSTIAIGLMGAAYFFGFTVGCLRGGELIRRVGYVRVFLAMSALASAVPLLHGLAIQPIVWGLLRMSTGFCFSVLYIVIESWLNEQSTNDNRGVVFSIYSMITLTVFAVGQTMTSLYDPTGLQLFIIASVLVSIGAIPVALSTTPSPRRPRRVSVNVRRLFRISPLGTLGCLAAGLANGSFWSLGPVFTLPISNSISIAAGFMTSAVIGGALSQWPLGSLSDRAGRRGVLIAVTVGACLTGVALYLFSPVLTIIGIFLLGALWGALAFTLYTIAVAYANDHAEPTEYVMVSSGLLLMYGVGATIGPFVAATLITSFGQRGLFLFTALIHLLLIGYAAIRIVRREPVDQERHSAFSDALTSAQTASLVYEEEIAQK